MILLSASRFPIYYGMHRYFRRTQQSLTMNAHQAPPITISTGAAMRVTFEARDRVALRTRPPFAIADAVSSGLR